MCLSNAKPIRNINDDNNQEQIGDSKTEFEVDNINIAKDDEYNINIFCVNKSTKAQPTLKSPRCKEYKVQVMVNNSLTSVIADTGAKVSVCGTSQARRGNLLSKMTPSTTNIKPYNSPSLPVYGEARCSVTFGSTSVPVVWHILSGSCEPILAGHLCEQLGIISFNESPPSHHPVRMIYANAPSDKKDILQNAPFSRKL